MWAAGGGVGTVDRQRCSWLTTLLSGHGAVGEALLPCQRKETSSSSGGAEVYCNKLDFFSHHFLSLP